MATILSTLYPPLVDTFMPAFPNEEEALINFTVSPYNSSYEIHYLHVTMVNQKTNKNAFGSDSNMQVPKGTTLINGVWIIPFTELLNNETNPYIEFNRVANFYTLHIPTSVLKLNNVNGEEKRFFVVDCYYKVQLRFDKFVENENDSSSLNTWNSNYLSEKRAYFSEWSSVCLIKAIPTISIHLNNFTEESSNYSSIVNQNNTNRPSNVVVPTRVPQYLPGIIPIAGNLTFEGYNDSGIDTTTKTEYYMRDIKTTSNNEYLAYYQIKIFNETGSLIKDSGIQYPAKAEKTNNFYWLVDLTEATVNETYTLELTFTTNNQYTFTKTFSFLIIEPLNDVNSSFNPVFEFNSIKLFDHGQEIDTVTVDEDGQIELTVSNGQLTSPGYLFIKRREYKSKEWNLIRCFYIADGENLQRTIVDNTLGSLKGYQYGAQYLTAKGSWTRHVQCDTIIYPKFHDILVSRQDKQLAIRYNAQITSMTPTVNRVKIDTLGSKYPRFAENAKLRYKQFQLNGLIIAESDYNRKFITDLDYREEMALYDEKMDGRYLIRNDTLIESDSTVVSLENGNGSTTDNTYDYGTYSQDISNGQSKTDRAKSRTQINTRHDMYPMDNWWWERKFREDVIEWLNDGEPKLYRSMTEGNLIVMFDSISLTPNPQLGRRVWNFSCTVYEIGDGNSLEELDALGIYTVQNDYAGTFEGVGELNTDTSVSRTRLGQTYHISVGENNPTTLVTASDFSKIYHNMLNSNQELNKVIVPTIGEEIGNLYQGLYENWSFNSSSIKLKDLRIQFESLPQWYDLDSMTPENTILNSWRITLENKNGERQEVEVYLDNDKLKVNESAGNFETPLWLIAGMSLTDFITEWENATGNLYFTWPYNDNGTEINLLISQDDYNQYNYYAMTDGQTLDGKDYIEENYLKSHRYRYSSNNEENIINSDIEIDIDTQYFKVDKKGELGLNNYIYISKDNITKNNDNIIYYVLINEKYYDKEQIDDNSPTYWKIFLMGVENPEAQYCKIPRPTYIKVDYVKDDDTNSSYERHSHDSNNYIYKKIDNPKIELLQTRKSVLETKINNLKNALYINVEDLVLEKDTEWKPSTEELASDATVTVNGEELTLAQLWKGYNKIDENENKVEVKGFLSIKDEINQLLQAQAENKIKLDRVNTLLDLYLNSETSFDELFNKWDIPDELVSMFEQLNLSGTFQSQLWNKYKDYFDTKQAYLATIETQNQLEIASQVLNLNEKITAINNLMSKNVLEQYNTTTGKPDNNSIEDNIVDYQIELPIDYQEFEWLIDFIGDEKSLINFAELFEYQEELQHIELILDSLENSEKRIESEIYWTQTAINGIKNKTSGYDYYIVTSQDELTEEQLKEKEKSNLIEYMSKIENWENIDVEDTYINISDLNIKLGNPSDSYFADKHQEKTYVSVKSLLNNQTQYYKFENNYYPIINIDSSNKYVKDKDENYYQIDNENTVYYKITSQDNNNSYIKTTLWDTYKNQKYWLHLKSGIQLEEGISPSNWISEKKIDLTQLYENLSLEDDNPDYQVNSNGKFYQTTYLNWNTSNKNYFIKLLKDVFKTEKDDNDNIQLKKYVFVKSTGKYYQKPKSLEGMDKVIGPGNSLYKINVDSGEDLTGILESISEEKNYSSIDKVVNALARKIIDSDTNKTELNNYGLGYKLKLNIISPYDKDLQLERTIFVDQKGYYQVPSTMDVKEITLFDGASATLDYIVEYNLKYDDVTEPNSYEVTENIVGQVSGEWNWNTSIQPLIYAKYFARDVETTGSKEKNNLALTGFITEQSVDYWKAISFDGTPYTILNIQSTNDTSGTQYIVGRSGVLNLQTDYPTTSLWVTGKRMVEVPKARQNYLDEWEYVLDDSVYGGSYEDSTTDGIYWWIVYNYEDSGINATDWIDGEKLSDDDPRKAMVIIQMDSPYDETTGREVVDNWYVLNETVVFDKVQILEPKMNTIYGIINTNGNIEYKIYYLDKGWFTVDFPNKNDFSIAHARVPVYGMFDYRATILKKLWEPKQQSSIAN